jgi:hypothetical protein
MKLKPSPALSFVDALDDRAIMKLLRTAVRKTTKHQASRVKSKR